MSSRTRQRVDLHAHTTVSDGEHSPEELVEIARARQVAYLGIADHDTVAGIARAVAAAQRAGDLEIIPGVEFSTDWEKREIHVLAYLVDYVEPQTVALAARFREGRLGRAQKMLAKLDALGVPVEFDAVAAIAGDAAIGRPHVARALLEAGHVATLQEAFDKYLASDKPAYVEYASASPFQAVEMIRAVGAVPVLAHPLEVTRIVPALVKAGLVGLECYYAQYDEHQQRELVDLAKQYGLLQTGGSDFHGLHRMGHMSALGEVNVPMEVVEKLKQAKAKIK
ncbi:MAG: PHP domain-containing protein [Chloroflexi bacterium]|nr:PHP domain-containing protein [Chloroflexota bacterium]